MPEAGFEPAHPQGALASQTSVSTKCSTTRAGESEDCPRSNPRPENSGYGSVGYAPRGFRTPDPRRVKTPLFP